MSNQEQKTLLPLKSKGRLAIGVFVVMEAFILFGLPAIFRRFGWGFDAKPFGLYAGFLYGIAASMSVIRKHRTSKPTTAFIESAIGQGASTQTPAAAKAQAQKRPAGQPVAPSAQTKKVTLNDIAGYKTTKESMAFLVECLKNRSALLKIGSTIPSGVLLYGPPGTGKTMMAAAIAGSAGVPFYSVNASSFINKYVGTGPAAIRSLYASARKTAPSVVFIDELDAIGGKRSVSDNDEYRSTLNALLSELDGLSESSGVLTIAATNRIDDLDSALVRPGRFDRKVAVPLPNEEDRLAILKIHSKNRPLDADVDLRRLAADTGGSSGAALATLMNEAGIYAVSRGSSVICREDIDKALFRSVTGGEETAEQGKAEQRLTAWHEAGHALCMKLLCDRNVTRLTIVGSTGGTNGITCSTEKQPRTTVSKKAMENLIKAVYGGRAAEEIFFGNTDDITASASGDIRQATSMIREYLASYGLGSGLLNLSLLTPDGKAPDSYIEEANALAERLYRETVAFLFENKHVLEKLANELVRRKTMVDEEISAVIYAAKAEEHKDA